MLNLIEEIDEVILNHVDLDAAHLKLCLVCEREITDNFKLNCNCEICKHCLYYWITDKNYSELFRELVLTCPNHNCRKEISLDWIYNNLKKSQVAVFNEILFKKFTHSNKDIRKCPKNDCPYLGYTDNIKCKSQFKCEICNETWYDPDILLVTNFDKFKNIILDCKNNFLHEITEFTILINCKPCKHCGFIIYKFEGCKHITCGKCNLEFCYTCLNNWSDHCEDNCNYKLDQEIIYGLFFFLLFVLKFLLSFYYIRTGIYYILTGLVYNSCIAIYFLLIYTIVAGIFYLKKDYSILCLCFAVFGVLIYEVFHVYLSYKSRFICDMNYVMAYEILAIFIITSVVILIKGWISLFKNVLDEFS